MIYLDNAATTSPKPERVIAAVEAAVREYTANPGRSGHAMASDCAQAVFSARKTAGAFFGVLNPEQVIFTPGCTYSVNMALKGMLKPGDHVIMSDLEHNAVVRPLHALAQTGVEVGRAKVIEGDHAATVANFRGKIKSNTRMIFCTQASNVFGLRLPVEELGRLCAEYGLLFGIDAAQSAGIIPIDMARLRADAICVPGHKGLYGVMGSGALLLKEGLDIHPIIEGGTGSASAARDMPEYLPDRLEGGTANIIGILAMAAGINFIESTGIAAIAHHEFSLIQKAYEGLSTCKGVKLYTSFPRPESHVPLISFNIDGVPSEETGAALGRDGIAVRAGFHCAFDAHLAFGTGQSGTVRVCPSVFTAEEDISALLDSVERLIKKTKKYE